MLETPRTRVVAIVVLLVALVGLFIVAGTAEPNPDQHDYPGVEHLITDYDAHVGESAELSGTVVATDPVVIETDHGDRTIELTVTNIDKLVDQSQELTLYGLVEPDHTIAAQTTIVRDQWEYTYMYAISVLAALWVFIRFVRQWRFDRDSLGFVPRGESDA